MEERNRSSEDLNESKRNKSTNSIEEEENRAVKIDEDELVNRNCSDCSGREESRASESEAVGSIQMSEREFESNFDESSHLLSEVPVEYSLVPLQSVEELKDQVRVIQDKPLKGNSGQSASAKLRRQVDLSPTSVTQAILSIPSPNPPELKLPPVENGYKQNSRDPKSLSPLPVPKTPSDGYNWRKYGQKQVKSPEGSRSYYRCTFSDCYAKKIECCDRFNRAIDTVYRSQHNHDPPQKVNCTRENRPASSIVPFTLSKESLVETAMVPEPKEQESSGSEETTEVNAKEEFVDGAECKKSQKRSPTSEFLSLPKPEKKAKYVVHTAGDEGISGDGYRWRKYGQKMVKGNPHPRNYYRCTSAGCPVRKHIEQAIDNTNAVVITYKGVHDHDPPVPRKSNGSKSATSSISINNSEVKESEPYQIPTPQWSVEKEGESTGNDLSLEGEKAAESTPSLLSIGFEIK